MVNTTERLGKLTGYFGSALLIAPWVLFFISYLLNPQWSLTRDALSDFGAPAFSHYAWVYNIGLGMVGAIICLMSLGIVATAGNKVQVFGGAFWFVAGIFLALIGYFHGGTTPHSFVSSWFFIQSAFAITIMGIGSYPDHDLTGAIAPIIIAILMPLGGILFYFPSVALAEIYEIIMIDGWAAFSLIHNRKRIVSVDSRNTVSTYTHDRRNAVIVGSLSLIFVVLFLYAAFVVMFTFT